MQLKLKDMCVAGELASGLKNNGYSHKRYKLYMSMERALGIIASGDMYFSDGSKWNDVPDRVQMTKKKAFGTCFSWATTENVAMWMLYGGNQGKNGAMIDFSAKVIKDILNIQEAEIGYFGENGKFIPVTLIKRERDYDVWLSDIIYTEQGKDGKTVKLTWGDEHYTTSESIQNEEDVFFKHYAWAYEKECRLIFKLKKEFALNDDTDKMKFIHIHLPDADRRVLWDNLYRSPVFKGDTDFGKPSCLFNEIEW